jgi:Tol biopolymer transport system component
VLGGLARKLITNIDSAIAFSPDGRQFVFTRGASNRGVLELRIANADGAEDRLLTSFSNVNVVFQDGAAWSPDGRIVALTVRDQSDQWALDTVSVPDGGVRELYSRPLGEIGRPVWLPDGGTLLAPVSGSAIWNKIQLWAFSYPEGRARRFTNDLNDYYWLLDLTRDGNTLATIETTQISNIWIAPLAHSSGARQLTFGGPPLMEVVETGGQLIARSTLGEVWKINPTSGERALFADVNNVNWIAPCGRFVVFNSLKSGSPELIRADSDGSNLTKLIEANTWLGPSCSPDGKSVFYVTLGPPKTIWRMPTEGGMATEVGSTLGEGNVSRLSVSPNGRLLAYAYEEHSREPATKLAVVPVEGGRPVKIYSVPEGHFTLNMWSSDGKGLQFLVTRQGVTNLWEQPLQGGKAKQLTAFTSGMIWDYFWSFDHKQLLLVRGETRSDVVLLKNFR